MAQGRPPLAVGTHGSIKTTPILDEDTGKVKHHKARARYRDNTGTTRPISRIGRSKGRAEANLKQAIADALTQAAETGGDLNSNSRYTELAQVWLDRVQRERAPHTYDGYRRVLAATVLPLMGDLRLREITPARVGGILNGLAPRYKPNGLRNIHKVMSGPLTYAQQQGIITYNPAHRLPPIRGKGKKSRALTRDEQAALTAWVEGSKLCSRQDFPDVMATMLGTGARVGEALALRWRDMQLDTEPDPQTGRRYGSMHICATVVRKTGVGMIRAEGTKTRETDGFDERTLDLPEPLVERIAARRLPGFTGDDDPVFWSARGGWRDPNRVNALIREFRDTLVDLDGRPMPLPWLTSHSFRHTCALALDEAGLSAREIADQLGHSKPSMSQDTYMERSTRNTPRAARALEERATRPETGR